MRTFVRHNGLSLFFFALFLAGLVGQALTGWQQFNAEQIADGLGHAHAVAST